MASPPYRSSGTSPPNPAYATLPNRASFKAPTPHLNKRRKQSSFSTASNHPLRQTSFPPEESAVTNDGRSPSVESDFTAVTGHQSVVNSTAEAKKKRGRKKKLPDTSARSETAKGALDGKSEGGQAGGDRGEEEEEEEEVPGDEGMVDSGLKVDAAAEKKKLSVLIAAFNPEQERRYYTFRRVKLNKHTVRRIVNQTLSQSVPPSVILTVNGFAKVFIGTLIERAREVQQQYVEAEEPLPCIKPKIEGQTSGIDSFTRDNYPFPTIQTGSSYDLVSRSSKKPEPLGPLLPDHLREAFRRHKRDGEGGGAGLAGVSLGFGLPGTGAARLQGKRLFR